MADPKRLELQTTLEKILDSKNVYYEPPVNKQISYPAFIYFRDRIVTVNANDKAYIKHKSYTITHISRVPDSPAIEQLLELPMCSFDRHYVADNLHHDVCTLYY